MQLYAIHKSGKKLWYPTPDALNCSSVPRSEIAAITIDEKGVTYPKGTFYLLGRDGRPKDGWRRITRPSENTENGHNLKVAEAEMPRG